MSLCTTLVSTGELDTHEVEALNALFAQSITCTQPGLPDLELSKAWGIPRRSRGSLKKAKRDSHKLH